MARMSDYTVRKCQDGKFRAFCNGYVLPKGPVPASFYMSDGRELERGYATREQCKNALRGYSYRGNR